MCSIWLKHFQSFSTLIALENTEQNKEQDAKENSKKKTREMRLLMANSI